MDDFKDKDNEEDEFSDSDKIPLNDLLKADQGDEEVDLLNQVQQNIVDNDENDDDFDQIVNDKMDEENQQV